MLGDVVLKLAVSEHVYRSMPLAQEGILTIARSRTTTNEFLSRVCLGAGLSQFVRGLTMSTGKLYLRYRPCGLSDCSQLGGRGLWNVNMGNNTRASHGYSGCGVRALGVGGARSAAGVRAEVGVGVGSSGDAGVQGVHGVGGMSVGEGSGTEIIGREEGVGQGAGLGPTGLTPLTIRRKSLADLLEALIGAFYRLGIELYVC